MSDNKKGSKSKSKGNISISQAEASLRKEIINEAKKIANQQTSSAYDLVEKTKELLRLESEKKQAQLV